MTTKEAAKEVGVKPAHLCKLVYNCDIKSPQRKGRSYDWTKKDIENAKEFLNRSVK